MAKNLEATGSSATEDSRHYYILLGRIFQLPRGKGHKRTSRSYSKVPHLTHPPIRIRKTATAPGSPYSLRIVRGFFYVPQNYQHSRNCETGPPTYRPYPRRLESLTICRWNYKGSTNFFLLKIWSFTPACVCINYEKSKETFSSRCHVVCKVKTKSTRSRGLLAWFSKGSFVRWLANLNMKKKRYLSFFAGGIQTLVHTTWRHSGFLCCEGKLLLRYLFAFQLPRVLAQQPAIRAKLFTKFHAHVSIEGMPFKLI